MQKTVGFQGKIFLKGSKLMANVLILLIPF